MQKTHNDFENKYEGVGASQPLKAQNNYMLHLKHHSISCYE